MKSADGPFRIDDPLEPKNPGEPLSGISEAAGFHLEEIPDPRNGEISGDRVSILHGNVGEPHHRPRRS